MSTPTQDVVAVLDSNLAQVFEKARAIKVSIGREAQAMKHPLETGASIVDHRIILPASAELSMLLTSQDYGSVYQQIHDLFKQGTLLTVQTRVDSYTSMLITKMPHDETPDVFDGITLALTLEEALFVQPQYATLPPSKVKRKKDSDTSERGQQQPTNSNQSVLAGWFK